MGLSCMEGGRGGAAAFHGRAGMPCMEEGGALHERAGALHGGESFVAWKR